MHRVVVILLKIEKVTLATSAFFPVMGFQESCDLQARPLGHAITVVASATCRRPQSTGARARAKAPKE